MKKYFSIVIGLLTVLTLLLVPQVSHAAPGYIASAVYDILQEGISVLTSLFLMVGAFLLWVSGTLLDMTISVTVLHMKAWVTDLGGIYSVWQVTRDLANMSLIFIILYIAIMTIVRKGTDYKGMLVKVVLVALFINFSLFFTNIMIDASNIGALMFYKGFTSGVDCVSKGSVDTGVCTTFRIVSDLGLGDLYKPLKTYDAFITNLFLGAIARVGGGIMMMSLAAVFIASSILLIYRFVVLIILMMFSAAAFAAQVLPQTNKYYKKWWDALVGECISAPAYFLFLWVVFKIIDSGTLKVGNIIDAIAAGSSGNVGGVATIIVNYTLVIMLLGYSVIFAKEMGAAGGDWATGTYKTLFNKPWKAVGGFVGRNVASGTKYAANATVGAAARTGLHASSKIITKAVDSTLGKNSYYGSRLLDVTAKPLTDKVKVFGQSTKDYETAEFAYEKARKDKIETAGKGDAVDKKQTEHANAVADEQAAYQNWQDKLAIDPTSSSLATQDAERAYKSAQDVTKKADGDVGTAVAGMKNNVTTLPVEQLIKNARHLSKDQMAAIQNSPDYEMHPDDKEAIKKARIAYFDEQLQKNMSLDEAAKMLKRIGDDIESLDVKKIIDSPDNDNVIKSLTEDQLKKLKEKGDKDKLQKRRVEPLLKQVKSAFEPGKALELPPTPAPFSDPPTPAEKATHAAYKTRLEDRRKAVRDTMAHLFPDEIAKVDNLDDLALMAPELSVKHLQAILDSTKDNPTKRDTLSKAVREFAKAKKRLEKNDPLNNWLRNDGQLF